MKNDKIHEQDRKFFNVKLYLEKINNFLPEVSMFDRQTVENHRGRIFAGKKALLLAAFKLDVMLFANIVYNRKKVFCWVS